MKTTRITWSIIFVLLFFVSCARTELGNYFINGAVGILNGNGLNLYEQTANGDNYVALKSPTSLSATTTYTLPSADGNSGQVLGTDGAGALDWISGGSGSGQKSFIDNGDFESGVGSVSTYDDSGAYVDGTGGSPSAITASADTSTELEKTTSLQMNKAASDASGEGLSVLSTTIDREDRGNALYVKFAYDFDDSNYTSGDVLLSVYDVTNSSILTVIPLTGLDDSAGILKTTGTAVGVIYPPSSCTSIRVSLHITSDSQTGSSWTAQIDSLKLSPDAPVPSGIVGPWQSYTPTVSWTTNTTTVAYWRRVGDSIEVRARLTLSGAPDTASLTLSIPNSYTINTNTSASVALGYGQVIDASAPSSGNTLIEPFISSGNIALYANGQVTQAVPITFASGDEVRFTIIFPVNEFSAGNTLNSFDVGFKPSKVISSVSSVTHTSTGNWQTVTGSYTDVEDNLSQFSNGTYTAAKHQYVMAFGYVYFAASATGQRGVRFSKNSGSELISGDFVDAGSGAGGTIYNVAGAIELDQGDTLELQGFQNSGGNLNYSGTGLQVIEIVDFSTFGVFNNEEKISSSVSDASYSITAGQWGDFTSISLTPGVWDIKAGVVYKNTSAGGGDGVVFAGIGITSGNNAADVGLTSTGWLPSTSGYQTTLNTFSDEVTVTATDTYYLKTFAPYTTNLNAAGFISARRVK